MALSGTVTSLGKDKAINWSSGCGEIVWFEKAAVNKPWSDLMSNRESMCKSMHTYYHNQVLGVIKGSIKRSFIKAIWADH